MKKLFAAILVLAVMLLTLTAFGETAANAFDEYNQKGYDHSTVSISGDGNVNVLQVCFNSADLTDCVLIEAVITDEQYEQFNALDFFDAEYYANEWNFVISLSPDTITVTSLNDLIPADEDVQKYAGKTVEELMNDNYFWVTDGADEEGNDVMIFCNDENHITFGVNLVGEPLAVEELSDEKVGSQVIASIRFWGFD